jgi:hypothetical protein
MDTIWVLKVLGRWLVAFWQSKALRCVAVLVSAIVFFAGSQSLAAGGKLTRIVISSACEFDYTTILSKPLFTENIFVCNCRPHRPFQATIFHEVERGAWDLENRSLNGLMAPNIKTNRIVGGAKIWWA